MTPTPTAEGPQEPFIFCPNGHGPRMTRDDDGNWNCSTCRCVMVLQTVWSNPEPWRTRRV